MARPQSGLDRRIVETARARFLIEGVDGASLRQIAKDAGTNIGMVYYYFPTKDDLFLAVVNDVYDGFLAAMSSVLAEDVPPDRRIELIYRRISVMTDQEFEVIRLIIREALISSSRLSKIADRFREGHLPKIFGMILEGISTGTFRQDVPPLAILAPMMAVGMFPQIMRRLVLAANLPVAPLIPDSETTAHLLADVLLNGVGGPARASRDVGQAERAAGARSTSPRPSQLRSETKQTPGKSETASSTKKRR